MLKGHLDPMVLAARDAGRQPGPSKECAGGTRKLRGLVPCQEAAMMLSTRHAPGRHAMSALPWVDRGGQHAAQHDAHAAGAV